ncbi:MAG TPA: YfhO family protein [Thermoanaerobaculaceae bacterium]|nr:YfhO family protein [Thermoanaerobaculaceae bacterium]HRS15841.1 YfhO family protein [Thermoanaerobaculaceae bacterium]
MKPDLAVLAWIAVPIALVHLACWRRRHGLLRFQLLVDVLLVLLPGRLVLQGLHLGPGTPAAPAWGGTATVAGIGDQIDLPLQFEVWWEEARRLVAEGEPPWISERIGGGAPLAAGGQSQLPFPLHAPVWALGARRGSDVMVFWKLELAALGAWLLFRRWGLRPAACSAGALAFAFGLYPLAWGVVPLAWVVAALPWVVWALVGAMRGRRRDGALAALLLGVMGGWCVHPETGGFLWLAAGSMGTVLAAGRWRRLARLAVPFVLALAVSGAGAVPTALTVQDSAKLAEIGRAPAYPLAVFTWELRARAAAMLVSPWREGHPADGTWRYPFAASVLLLGAGAAPFVWMLAGRPRRRLGRHRLALAVLAGWAFALVFQLPVLADALARVPVLGVMTWPRAGLLPGFVLAACGAIGADAVLRRPHRGRIAAATAAVGAAALLLALTARPGVARHRLVPGAVAPVAAGAASLAGQGWLLPVVVGAESALNAWDVLGACRGGEPGGAELAEALVREQAREGGRVLALASVLPANRAAAWGLPELASNDPVRSRALTALHQALGSAGLDLPGPFTRPWAGLAGAWGVRWLATPPGEPTGELADGWEAVEVHPGGAIHRNTRALPVLRLAAEVVAPPGDAASGAWEALDFSAVAVGDRPRVLGGEGWLEVREQRPWRWHAEIRAQGRILAVLHVPRAPGWRAWLDGREVSIETVNLAAMAVEVPEGIHAVLWRYRPPGLGLGVVLTVLGLAGCAALWSRRW